jgi:hypothetical protein
MITTLLNITIDQGADYIMPFPPILDASGNPVNITNAVAAMQLRTAIGDPTALLTLTTANGGLTPTAGGIWVPFVSESVTTALSAGLIVYDLKMLLNGITSFPFRGTATIPGEVTTIELSPPSPPSPSNSYTGEDGTTVYTGEDGTTNFNQEF